MTGAKAPLILRVPHARLRLRESLVFDAVFQTLTAILVASKMQAYETASFFSYNEKSARLVLPTRDKYTFMFMLPEKLKTIEKAIQVNKTTKFVLSDQEATVHLHKGFKMLTEALFIREDKLDWLEVNYKVFKPLLPIR
jgi:hypothetical protein